MSTIVDLLDEDKPIAEQKFVCLSFISPEYIIKQKELFFFENFTKQYHFNKTAELLTQYSNYLSFKYGINSDEMMEELKAGPNETQSRIRNQEIHNVWGYCSGTRQWRHERNRMSKTKGN